MRRRPALASTRQALIRQRMLADLPDYGWASSCRRRSRRFYQAFAAEVERAVRGGAEPARAARRSSSPHAGPERLGGADGELGAAGGGGGGHAVTTTRSPGRLPRARPGRPDVLAAVRLCPGGAGELCRPEQPQGRAHRGLVDFEGGNAAGQGRDLRRRPPLARARAARNRVPQLLPRVRAAVRRARHAGQPRDPAADLRGDAGPPVAPPGSASASTWRAAGWRARSPRCARHGRRKNSPWSSTRSRRSGARRCSTAM